MNNIHPKLARGIRKLELMEKLGSNSEGILKEGKKYYCYTCKYHPYGSTNCLNPRNSNNYYIITGFYVYKCWVPKPRSQKIRGKKGEKN